MSVIDLGLPPNQLGDPWVQRIDPRARRQLDVLEAQRRLRRRVVGAAGRVGAGSFFWRQESASMSITRQCWVKRSTRAATQAAPGKIVPHCLNARFVVMMVARCS